MKTDTPETDDAWCSFRSNPELLDHVEKLSRKLERELNEARFDLDFSRRLADWQGKTIDDLTAQRDRLAEALRKVSRSWNYGEVAQQALQSLTQNAEP